MPAHRLLVRALGARRRTTPCASLACLVIACAAFVGASSVSAQSRAPVIQDRVRLDPSEPVGFRVLMTPDTVYVGQQATYEIGVFITEAAQQRMRRNPEVVPAELRGVLAYDLGGPQSLPAITQNGVRSFPHVLQRALFPLAPGRLEIPASQLTYTLPRSASFFSREESAVMRADDVYLHVKPLPQTGQPSDFGGAVGVLSVAASLDSTEARVGEPLLLTVRVTGRGNVKLWPRPALTAPGATLVPAGERVVVDTAGQYVRGRKEFDWLVTPEREGTLAVPVVQYAYFDPYAEQYEVATTDPIGITIAAGEFVSSSIGDGDENRLALRARDRGPQPQPWSRNPLFWALLVLAPLPALRRRQIRPTERETADTRAIAVPVSAAVTPASPVDRARRAASQERRQFVDALAERLATNASELSAHAAVARRLRRRGVTRATTAQVLALLAELDASAWARADDSSPATAASARARVDALLAQVALEAIAVGEPAARGVGRSAPVRPLAMLLFVGTTLTVALGGIVHPLHARVQQAEQTFDTGVAAYTAGRFADAEAAFASVAVSQPRNADAWANLGAAAWAQHDTVSAVQSWHRALRLEPTAADVRGNLSLLPSGSRQGIADVPSMPLNAGTAAAALLWLLGWVVLAWSRRGADSAPPRRVERTLPRAGIALLVFAICVGGWQFAFEQRLSDERLAVVDDAAPMRVAPGRDANLFGGTARGDVVQRGETRLEGAIGAEWIAVRHADGREGWMPSRALVPLL